MRRKRRHRRKKRIWGVAVCLLGILCSVPAWHVSADPQKEPESQSDTVDTALQNVRSEGCVPLPVWNPLQEKAEQILGIQSPGYGVHNVYERIKLLYKENGTFRKRVM